MLLKEILSREKYTLNEIVDKKICNSKLYEKSYIRNLFVDSTCLHSIENNKHFSTQKKKLKHIKIRKRVGRRGKRGRGAKRKKIGKKRKNQKVKELRSHRTARANFKWRRQKFKKGGHKGHSSYTTVLLYRSRKTNFIRFESIKKSVCGSNHFIDLFLKGVRTLITGKIKKRENSLMILSARKGGFRCYSSGFRGFLPKTELKKIINRSFHNKSIESASAFKKLLAFRKVEWLVSSPPRFRFVIQALTRKFRFRRNKFVLSRKKKYRKRTRMLSKFLFFSISRRRSKGKLNKIAKSKFLKKFLKEFTHQKVKN